MIRTSLVLGSVILAVCSHFAAGQQHRIFVQQAGMNPNDVPPEGITISAIGGETITLDCYAEHTPPGSRLRGVIGGMLCSLSGGTAGTITFVPAATQDLSRADSCFYGPRYCDSGENIGLVCADASECTGGDANPCSTVQRQAATDDGGCAFGGHNPRAYVSAVPAVAIVVTEPCYIGTFTYQVSTDAEGTFVLTVPNEPDSASRDQNETPIPFVTSGATIDIPNGRCCEGTQCLGEMAAYACSAQGGAFTVNETCAAACCVTASDCANDNNVCTHDSCAGSGCRYLPVQYGDVNGSGGVTHLNDILCLIMGFSNPVNCPNGDIHPPCTGDGLVNLDDILKVLAAFGGFDPCGCSE